MSVNDDSSEQGDPQGVTCCPICQAENAANAISCERCGCPLTVGCPDDESEEDEPAESCDPLLLTWKSHFAFIGAWLVLGTMVLVAGVELVDRLAGSGAAAGPILTWQLLLTVVIASAALITVTVSYVLRMEHKPGRCFHCGYLLYGLKEPRCPECGAAFDERELAAWILDGSAEANRLIRIQREDVVYAAVVLLAFAMTLVLPVLKVMAYARYRDSGDPDSEFVAAHIELAGFLLAVGATAAGFLRLLRRPVRPKPMLFWGAFAAAACLMAGTFFAAASSF